MSSSPADELTLDDISPAGTAELWRRLADGADGASAVAALLGFPMVTARQLVGRTLATSDEAEDLLGSMHRTVRSLAIATTTTTERCHGEIRGPVLWSETMSARSASAGDEGLYVCVLPAKAYDTLENRVLASALAAIVTAARDAQATGDFSFDDEVIRRADHNGHLAARWLEHRTLLSVPRKRPDGRAFRRARSGHRRRIYLPAVALLERAARPLRAADLLLYADAQAVRHHDLVAAVVERLERRGHPCGRARAEHGTFWCGPVSYRRPQTGDLDDPEVGVHVGEVVLDVPRGESEAAVARARVELARRVGDRPHVVVTSVADIESALDLAGFPSQR